MSGRSTVEELISLVGPARVSVDPGDLGAHARDWSPRALLARRAGEAPRLPLAVVRPHDTVEVARLLEWAHVTRTAVVPFGGGSSVVEGIEGDGSVVVDLGDLDGISDVDDKSRLVTAGAGVKGPALRSALNQSGYMLGHEPQSHDISTVGGWIATRACGQLSAGYGGIERLVAGLEAVLPGGRTVRSKVAPRSSTGLDLAALMLGSEGTLGIVTEITLRVSPLPQTRVDACVRFEHMRDAIAACRNLAQSRLAPTLVRAYDAEDAVLFTMTLEDPPAGPLLLLSFYGDDAPARAESAVALSEGEELNDRIVDHWWNHRNAAVGDYAKLMAGQGMLGPHAMIDTMEVSGTWTVLRDLYHSMKARLAEHSDMVACHVSHVYPDGACLYFTLAKMCSSDAEAAESNEAWWETGMSTCLEAGGAISHHHGIGRLRARWLPAELGDFFEVLKAVKGALDPHGIMNPGVLGLDLRTST
ncbi:MAG: FAD-binding oxidoreductase [Actinomycetota bacterium]